MAFRKVAQFKEATLEYVSPGGIGTFKFSTDMPGGHITLQKTANLPQTNADKTPATTTISLVDGNGAPIEGTLFVPRVDPPANGTLQLRGGVVWLRPVGVYLDGALNEFWDTLPIPIGV